MERKEELKLDGIRIANKNKLNTDGIKFANDHISYNKPEHSKPMKARKTGEITQKQANKFLLKSIAVIGIGLAIYLPMHNSYTELMYEKGAIHHTSPGSSGGPEDWYEKPNGFVEPTLDEITERTFENIGNIFTGRITRFK